MPTEAENIQYLYLILTHDGSPNFDWDAVGADLNLNKGTVTKRWSRLKTALEKGDTPNGSTYQFLWLCVKQIERTGPLNWVEIAQKCNTTTGAASKRYSRMKIAFEKGNAVPDSPAKPKTKRKLAIKDETQAAEGVKATPNAKRKRVAAKATTPTDSDDGNTDHAKPKRIRISKATPKPKAKVIVKQEDKDQDVDRVFDDTQGVLEVTAEDTEAVSEDTGSTSFNDMFI